MQGLSLQFQSAPNGQLYVMLLLAIAAALTVHGILQIIRRQLRGGLISLAAALGAVGPALLIDGMFGGKSTSKRRWDALATARALSIAGSAIVVIAIVMGRKSPQMVWLVVLAFQIVVAVAVFYAAVYAYLRPGQMVALMSLRCAAIVALLLILFKPAISFTPQTGDLRAVLPILVDRSGSMGTAEPAYPPNRYRYALQRLLAQRSRIEQHFQPIWCDFAKDVNAAGSLDELHERKCEGDGADGTDIASALAKASAGYDRNELAGILLISDGIHNAPGEVIDSAAEAGARIYTAALGSTNEARLAPRNARIVSLDAPITAVRNNITTITARVKMSGLAGKQSELQLLEEDNDQPVDVFTLRTSRNSHTLIAQLRWTPKAPPEEDATGDADVRKLSVRILPLKNEVTTDDNAAELHVLVTQPSIRVLYIEGSIRPEYKFLRRRLGADPNVQLATLINMGENHFWSSGALDGKALKSLPTTEEDFKLFDVLILGDLDASFLTREQMRIIRQFVTDGGALLMLGGHNSLGPGGYGGTDVEATLPVLLGRRTQPQESTPFLPQLTADAIDHPIFKGIAGCFPTHKRNEPQPDQPKLPDLLGCVSTLRARGSAKLLAVHPTRRNANGPLVVLAVQRYGVGRSAVFTGDTTWRWCMPMFALGADSPYQRFWGQLIRWLGDVEETGPRAGSSLVLRTSLPGIQAGEIVKLRARVAGEKGHLTSTASVSCAVIDQDNKQLETFALAPTRKNGFYEANYKAVKGGKLRLQVSAVDDQGEALSEDTLPITVAPRSAEADRLARDEKVLSSISQASGGVSEDIVRLPELIDAIIQRHQRFVPPPKVSISHLYNFTALFLIFVALMTGEWLLRRNWQLH